MKFTNLPKLMQDAMRSLNELNNTPPEMAIQVVLGVSNLAVHHHYNVNPRYYAIRPISLFLLNLSPTGATKTTNFNELIKGIERFEEEERIRLKDEKQRYDIEKKIYDKKEAQYVKEQSADNDVPTSKAKIVVPTPTQQAKKLKSMISALNGNVSSLPPKSLPTDAPVMPKPVQTAKLMISKSTVNGVIQQLKSQSMVGFFSGEAGDFFNGHAFQGGSDNSKAIEMAAALTSMWDGSKIEKLTGPEQVTHANRRVSMCFLLQETTIRKFLSNPQYADQGFVHRILITQCDYFDTPDYNCDDTNMRRISNARAKLEPFHQRIYELISKPVTIKEGTDFELVLETLELSQEAMMYLDAFGNDTKKRVTGDLKDYAGFIARAHEHAMRLAATLAAFEKQSEITLDNAKGAVELMEFFIEQRRSLEIESAAKNSSQVEVARRLVEQLKEAKFDGTLNEFRRIGRFGYQKFDADQREATLKEMLSTGEVEIYETTATNGKTVSMIRCV